MIWPLPYSPARAATVNVIRAHGFRVTHAYSDGVVRLERADGVFLFVGEDGKASPPQTWPVAHARIDLKEAGVVFR